MNEPIRHADIFEEKTGITGVAARYRMPGGQTSAAYEKQVDHLVEKGLHASIEDNHASYNIIGRYFLRRWTKSMAELLPQLNTMLDELVALNPSLADLKIPRQDPVAMAHTLMGITSGFNVSDINSFVNKASVDSARQGALEEMLGVSMQWFPSDTTLAHIEQEVVRSQKRRVADVALDHSITPERRYEAQHAVFPPSPPCREDGITDHLKIPGKASHTLYTGDHSPSQAMTK